MSKYNIGDIVEIDTVASGIDEHQEVFDGSAQFVITHVHMGGDVYTVRQEDYTVDFHISESWIIGKAEVEQCASLFTNQQE